MLPFHPLNWFSRLTIWFTHIGRDSVIYPTAERIQMFALGNVLGLLGLLVYHYRAGSAFSILVVEVLALLLALLLWLLSRQHPHGRFPYLGFYSLVIWYCFTMANAWAYVADDYSRLRFVILLITVSTYYLMAEWWHIALASLVTVLCCYALAAILHLPPAYPPQGDWVLLATTHICWLGFSLSNRSKREERLRDTQALVRHMQRALQPGLQSLEALLPELRYALAQVVEAAAPAEVGAAGDNSTRIRSIAKRLQNNTEAMEDYLDLQCINARYLSLEGRLEVLSAAELVRDVVDNYPYTMESFKAAVGIQVEHDFHFLGVREQWRYALINIFHNALTAVFCRGVRPPLGAVQIAIGVQGEQGWIRVVDQGIGLAAQDVPYVFEPFYATGKFAGFGLGLSYCRAVAEGAGGRIALSPLPTQGCRVQITLPRVQERV